MPAVAAVEGDSRSRVSQGAGGVDGVKAGL